MKSQQETVLEFQDVAEEELQEELVGLMETTLRLEYELQLVVGLQ